jgi:hypothetical protein
MTTTATKVHAVKIEDYEGNGACAECGRESLRWIVTLSDGTQVGVECSAKVCGEKFARKTYVWTAEFAPVAEYCDATGAYVLWQHKAGAETRTTRNGLLIGIGGQRAAWQKFGWVA